MTGICADVCNFKSQASYLFWNAAKGGVLKEKYLYTSFRSSFVCFPLQHALFDMDYFACLRLPDQE